METIKLYYEDAYIKEFTAKVLSCVETESKVSGVKYAVCLDKTAFFPEEGGQTPDKGTIGDARVLDVQIKDEVITHYTDKAVAIGENVKAAIDWKHRFSNMQQHTGEHIFSGIVNSKFGYENVGFHLSDQIVTMDYNGPMTKEELEEIEYLVNEAIARNVEVTQSFPTKEELKSFEYRSKKEIPGQVRIVTVEGYDVCACCAPHVSRTGEIGGFKIQSSMNYKGGVRVSMLCGFRALEAARAKAEIVASLMKNLSANQENIVEIVDKQKANIQTLKQELVAVKKELLNRELKAIDEGEEHVIFFCEGIDGKTVRQAVLELATKHSGYCMLLSGNDNSGYSYVAASESLDCKKLETVMKEALSAKGGGDSKMIQGSMSKCAEEIERVYREFLK